MPLASVSSATLEDRRGYLTLVVTAQREGKLLLRKTEGIREWQQAVSGLLGGGEKGGMATTREFWSRRQFSDCQGAQEWLLARQRTGTHRSSGEPPSGQLSVTLRLSPPAHIFSSSSHPIAISMSPINPSYLCPSILIFPKSFPSCVMSSTFSSFTASFLLGGSQTPTRARHSEIPQRIRDWISVHGHPGERTSKRKHFLFFSLCPFQPHHSSIDKTHATHTHTPNPAPFM